MSEISEKGLLGLALDFSQRDGEAMKQAVMSQWRAQGERPDLWVFGYASLVWRPEFPAAETRLARVFGHHRSLQMWSHVNRGTMARPGLVFALLPGGSCDGVVLRIPHDEVEGVMPALWDREMPDPVYDPKWLRCRTAQGPVQALAFTLSRQSPSFTGPLSPAQYREIFAHARGRYGSTLDYAQQTFDGLLAHGIHDHALERLLHHAQD